MTANDPLERRIADHYAAEIPHRAPDRVLDAALAVIDTTPQRRVLLPAPWRFPTMNGFAKAAVATVAVIAIGALGLAILGLGSGPGVGGQPSPSPTASPEPDASAPPPLGATFTSTIHGLTISYPRGWTTIPATEPWTSMEQFNMGSSLDHVWDPSLQDHLSVNLGSQPLDGKPGETWATEFFGHPELAGGCGGAPQAITVDGANGLVCTGLAAIWTRDRGYVVWLYQSPDDPWTKQYYDQAWFRGVLDTVQLRPEDAVSPTSSGSPAPTPS
jgi:hypothetical protein